MLLPYEAEADYIDQLLWLLPLLLPELQEFLYLILQEFADNL